MGGAIEPGLREQFIALKQQGLGLKSICANRGFLMACKLSARFKKQGDLQVHYSNCGAKGPLTAPLLVGAALWLRRLLTSWEPLLFSYS